MERILVPVAPGELVDKLTILEIKSERIQDSAKRANVARELNALQDVWTVHGKGAEAPDVADARQRLRSINEELWDIEDAIREREANRDFGQRFVELARAVYLTNARRAAVKREINEAFGSDLVEEKSYQPYD